MPSADVSASRAPAADSSSKTVDDRSSADDWPTTLRTDRDPSLYGGFPSLDGLRAVAILWVLSFHLPGQAPPEGNPLTNRGPLGVELFFAISGFLVTRSLHQCAVRVSATSGGTGAALRDFFSRRVSRIWPPYFLAFAIAIAGMLLDPAFRERSSEARQILWSFVLFVANYEIPSHEPTLSLMVLWSLCFEEQFYLILGIMYALGGRHFSRWLLLAALCSIVLRLAGATTHPEIFPRFLVMQMQLHWRFDSLAWGCLAWLYHRRIVDFWTRIRARSSLQALVVFASVAVCVPFPEGPLSQALSYLILAPVFAMLVVTLALSPPFWLGRALSWRPLTFVGVISYELYLSHIFVYRLVARLRLDQRSLVYYGICFALSIGVAWVFHTTFSKPTQRMVRSWIDRRDAAA